jgi:hypothetical protein
MNADQASAIVRSIEKMIAGDKERDWADVLFVQLLSVGGK